MIEIPPKSNLLFPIMENGSLNREDLLKEITRFLSRVPTVHGIRIFNRTKTCTVHISVNPDAMLNVMIDNPKDEEFTFD